MIQVQHLTKRFGNRVVVRDLSFQVERGEVVALLGPNGAGKTTTMRILACYLQPTSGSVTIAGHDVCSNSLEARRRIGYLPENVPLYPELRVHEYLDYRARLKGLRGSRRRRRVHEVLSMCGIEDARARIIGQLSKGYRQRVGIADSLVGDPEILILDEPSLGLDPNQRRDLRDLIRQLSNQHTVLLSSHLLSEVEAVCSRTIIISEGTLLASDTPANLVRKLGGRRVVKTEIRGPRESVMAALDAVKDVEDVHLAGEQDGWLFVTLVSSHESDVRPELIKVVTKNDWELREVRAETDGFEEAFVKMIRGAQA